MFVDKVKIIAKAGNGGKGIVSFRHEKYIDKGGPDGGDGGNGGDIIAIASNNQDTLARFRFKKLIQAENGENGSKRKMHGRSGKNLELKLPIGTVITSQDGEVLADLTDDGQRAVIAKGGRGGFGNAHFTSSTRQAPRVAEKGEFGDELELNLEIKMIADVGLVGLPNAGKSTLLSKISNARPDIANYPFTTLTPNLGVVDASGSSFLVADIPGLIEGASEGKGLGDEFLRHVERTSILLHLIDAYSSDPRADYDIIIKELKNYTVDISKKPQVVIVTKIEGLDDEMIASVISSLRTCVPRKVKILVISALSGQGLKELIRHTSEKVAKARTKRELAKQNEIPVITFEQPDDRWSVSKTEKGFLVIGKKIESFAKRTDFDDFHGRERMRDILQKRGVLNTLLKQGLEFGQVIEIGNPKIGEIEY